MVETCMCTNYYATVIANKGHTNVERWFKVILYSYLILKKMNERITDG